MRNSITEDVDEFGNVGAETSYLQSRMHSDYDSAESIADSDLEGGELRKMLASQLKRQNRKDCETSRKPIAPGEPAAMLQERGASAKRTQADHSRRESLTSSSSQEPRATEKHAAMFSSGNEEPGNQFKSSIFKNADTSNLGRSLTEGNKDHLLSQARSDLMRQEYQGDLSIIVSVSFSINLMLKEWNYRTHNTEKLNLDENNFVHKKNYL